MTSLTIEIWKKQHATFRVLHRVMTKEWIKDNFSKAFGSEQHPSYINEKINHGGDVMGFLSLFSPDLQLSFLKLALPIHRDLTSTHFLVVKCFLRTFSASLGAYQIHDIFKDKETLEYWLKTRGDFNGSWEFVDKLDRDQLRHLFTWYNDLKDNERFIV